MPVNRTVKKLPHIYTKLLHFIGSFKFFVILMGFFVFEAVWVGLTAIFPGAFDEETHLGIINYYAHHINPFFSTQPAELNQFGVVMHSPSYIFHFLMSFPWRLTNLLTDNFRLQVILMRLINIALFTIGLILFRKVLQKITKSMLMINLVFLIVILTPICVQVASQINYDNLMMILVPLNVLLVLRVKEDFKNVKFSVWNIAVFIGLSLLTVLVKYTFLPFMVAMYATLVWSFLRLERSKRQKLRLSAKINFKLLSIGRRAVIILFLVFSIGLFFERYGMNAIRYHSANPDCVSVIGARNCESYSIYRRGVIYVNSKPAYVNKNPVRFTYLWAKHMEYNAMMTINGPASGYSIGIPLPLPYLAAIVFSVLGIVLSIFYWRTVFKTAAAKLFLLIIAMYLGSLWLTNYSGYLETGRRVAIQGRYLVPILPVIYLIFFLAYNQLLIKKPTIKHLAASTLILFFILGGGVMSFIVHSDNAWYWEGNSAAQTMNKQANKVLRRIVPGAPQKEPYWQNSFDF